MAALKVFYKDPDEVLDYTIDWTNWLDTDTISTSSWTVASGLTEDSESNNTTSATVWVSGGSAGTTYKATNTIVTADGRTKQGAIELVIGNK